MSEKLSERKWEYEIFPKSIAQELFNFYFEGINGAGFVGKDYESLCNKVESAEAEVKRLSEQLTKTQPYHERSRIVDAESRLAKAQDVLKEIGTPIIRNVGWARPIKHEVCFSTELWAKLEKSLGGVGVGV